MFDLKKYLVPKFRHFLPLTNCFGCLVLSTALTILLRPTLAWSQNKYLGAASCASSNCHGSVSPKSGTNVLQNEYATWYKSEAHAQAWKVLTNKESKTIASHLGIKSPEIDPLCLKCHATYVPKSAQGEKFRLADGVSCESCHGPSEKWIKSHTAKDSSHSQNVSLGMIDMVSLSERARICMECHFGTDDQEVNHRLIGAGHPRLTYELDTYGVLQPNHWEIDKDYVERKGAYNSSRAWLAGQVLRSIAMLEAMLSEKRSKFGVLPELSQYYCYNCHHSLAEDQWKTRSYGGRPGELRLNVSSLEMVHVGLKVLDTGLAQELRNKLAQFDIAHREGKANTVISETKDLLTGKIRPLVDRASFNESTVQQMISSMISYSTAESFYPYEIAEQVAMGLSALTATADPGGKRYKAGIDAIYESLKKEEVFDPVSFKKAASKLSAK